MGEFYGDQFGAPDWGIYANPVNDELSDIKRSYSQTGGQAKAQIDMLREFAANPQYRGFLRTLLGVEETVAQSKWIVWLLAALLVVMVLDLLLRIRVRWR